MKILHIIPRFIGGGPERHLLALASAWRAADRAITHTLIVLATPASALLVVRARRLGITVHIAPDLATVRDAVATADVVDLTFWNHPALYELLRQPLPPARWMLRSAVAGTTAPQVLIAALGACCDAMVLSAPASANTPAVAVAQRRGCRIECIPSLADMQRLDGFVPVPHDGVRVGYLGLIEPTKMHPAFAEFAAAVTAPNVRFEVYGDGSWSRSLHEQCAAAGLSERVHFHGHVEDIRAAFATMDMFGYPLAPDSYATSEKVIQEAMWVGVPPVVLANSAAASLVPHERAGLVCQTEAEYPRAIDRLATDAALRTALGDGARRHAREHFNPQRNADRFLSVLEDIASRPKRAWQPLPGRDATGAQHFVQALGELGSAFAQALAAPQGTDPSTRSASAPLIGAAGEHAVAAPVIGNAAECEIAASSPGLAHGEGGVVQYRNAYPHDPHLRLWSGLIARAAGRDALARTEFDDARQLRLHRAAETVRQQQ